MPGAETEGRKPEGFRPFVGPSAPSVEGAVVVLQEVRVLARPLWDDYCAPHRGVVGDRARAVMAREVRSDGGDDLREGAQIKFGAPLRCGVVAPEIAGKAHGRRALRELFADQFAQSLSMVHI